MDAPLGHFDTVTPAPECLDELIGPVADAVRDWHGSVPAEQILHVDTDPRWADTAVFVEHYGQDLLEASANCVVVSFCADAADESAVNAAVRAPVKARKRVIFIVLSLPDSQAIGAALTKC